MIKPFTGVGDVTAWLTKVELVAALSDITPQDLVNVIPLYLEGGALAVYLEMSKADREDINKLKKGLYRAFSDSPFTAYSKLKGSAVDWGAGGYFCYRGEKVSKGERFC